MVCRPDLRDEWIAPTDADAEVEDAVVRGIRVVRAIASRVVINIL